MKQRLLTNINDWRSFVSEYKDVYVKTSIGDDPPTHYPTIVVTYYAYTNDSQDVLVHRYVYQDDFMTEEKDLY